MLMTERLQKSVEELASIFSSHFPTSREGERTIGRESEYPVVLPNGDAFDVQQLWPLLIEKTGFRPLKEGDLIVGLEGEDASFSLEVGWGTIEIITRPCQHLHEMCAIQDKTMESLLEAVDSFGAHVLGCGIQPKTPPTHALMSGKKRYGLLLETIGEPWLWFATTASDQLHVSVVRDEVVSLLNIGNVLACVSIALCGNSSVYGGQHHGFISSREGQMKTISSEQYRHGMPARAIRDIEDWIALSAQQQFLMNKKDGVYEQAEGTFASFIEENGVDFEAFLMHDHYLWNSARARTAHGTIELRSPCQQPWPEHYAAATLGVGLFEAGEALSVWLDGVLGDALWPTMRAYHHDVIHKGLAADEPFEGFLRGVLERCEAALVARGFGEESLMAPLWKRLEAKQNPGQQALAVFEEGGMEALIPFLAIR
tara:strand:+ start:14529 stop:15809 length:1281 start_codon:yes stop_codon:yes gene_type:complete